MCRFITLTRQRGGAASNQSLSPGRHGPAAAARAVAHPYARARAHGVVLECARAHSATAHGPPACCTVPPR